VGPFEYLLLFAAIILGLAITDVSVSLHRLLGAGRRVRWDWLAPLAAIVAVLKIVTQWWTWYGAERLAGGLTFEMFVGVVTGAILLFLMAAAALPDDTHGEGVIDLRVWYASVFRRYWLLFLAHWLLMTGVSVWAQVVIGKARFDAMSPALLMAPAALSLVLIKNRWWQTLGLVGFAALYLLNNLGKPLTH
jgi:hypothetical protein